MPEIHLRFGGSSAHRWMACPGSARLLAGLPPQRETPAMLAGTDAHKMLEDHLRSGEVPPLMGVRLAWDYIMGVLESMKDGEMRLETLVQLADDVGGSADVMLYDHDTDELHVIDFKNGRRYVDAGAPQLRLYAAAALASVVEWSPGIIHCTVIQPTGETGEAIRTESFTVEEIEAFGADALEAAKLAREPDAPVVPGTTQCKWCPAFATCQAGYEETAAMPRSAEVKTLPALPDPEGFDYLDGMGALVHLLPRVKAWVKMVSERLNEMAARKEIPPDCKLSQRKLARVWVDEEMAKKWLSGIDGIVEDTYNPRRLLSPAQLEDAAGKWLLDLANAEGQTTQPLSQATLVPERKAAPKKAK